MKITFSNLKRRYKINCEDGVAAFIDGAACAGDAYATLTELNRRLPDYALRGLQAVYAGECAAVIYGNVVFKKS